MNKTENTFQAPGANMHSELRGNGPVLLLIPGGNGDGLLFGPLADALADRYTVVTYDRRGFSRSELSGPVSPRRIETDSEDAHRLLAEVAPEPAYVLGSSSGAIVALELLCRHPGQIRTLIAHEPPIATLLPDSAHWLEFFDAVYDTYRRDGADTAMANFSARMGVSRLQQLPGAAQVQSPTPEVVDKARHNRDFFLEHEVRQYPRFVPDIEALKSVLPKLILAGGDESRTTFPHRTVSALADQLGSTVTDLPGGHVGYATQPAQFAARLSTLLTK
jgi:acetyltransferase/esterase